MSMVFRLAMWNKVEFKMHRESLVKKKKKTKKNLKNQMDKKAVLGLSSIPDKVKEFFIRKLIKRRYQEFIAELKE